MEGLGHRQAVRISSTSRSDPVSVTSFSATGLYPPSLTRRREEKGE